MAVQIDGVSPEQLLDLASEFTVRRPTFRDCRLDAVRIVKIFQPGGSHRWAVYKGYWTPPDVLNRDGTWEAEPSPSNRDDEFYERCRFDEFEHAFAAAQQVCLAESPPVTEALLRLRQPA